MSGNNELVLVGTAGAGAGGTSLAWFADTGITAPTDATTALAAGFKDAGLVADSGLVGRQTENSTDINAFGANVPARTVVTSAKTEFDITFLESNAVTLAVYNRLALTDLTVDASGAVDFTTGMHRTQRYAAVFDVVDGNNHIRAFCPEVEVTGRNDFSVAGGAAISYGVTLTAYQGSDGVAIHWFYLLDALATG